MKKLIFLFALALSGCVKDPLFTDAGILTDPRDNNTYKTVQIGTQTWMAENLAYLPDVGPMSKDKFDYEPDKSPFYYVYGYEGELISEAIVNSNFATYGVLYNELAAKEACPQGWRLPGDDEMTILKDFLGKNAGEKLKSASDWKDGRNGNNSSGFNALPGGETDKWSFYGIHDYAKFWCADSGFWYLDVNDYFSRGAWFGSVNIHSAYSIRCLKN